MSVNPPPPSPHEVRAAIRRNFVSAGLGAACLIYFGYFRLAHPTGRGMFELANLAVYHAFRVGGPALLVIALVSLSGAAWVMVADAVVSMLLGIIMFGGGGLMIMSGGWMSGGLLCVFGAMFFKSGRSNAGLAHEAFRLTRSRAAPPPPPATPPPAAASESESHATAALLRHRHSSASGPVVSATEPGAVVLVPTGVATTGDGPSSSAPARQDDAPRSEVPSAAPTPTAPPPEGFLASFAPKPPSDRA